MALEVRPFDAPLGAEIIGLDLSYPASEADVSAVRQALLDHLVIAIRGQEDLSAAQHIEFSRRFGPLQIHVVSQFLLADHPEILIVSNIQENGRPIGLGDAGHYWHSDLSYKSLPSLGALLHARELPQEGGDTLFNNMYLAYDTLAPGLKARAKGLSAVHSYLHRYAIQQAQNGDLRPSLTDAQKAQVEAVHHPVVRTHPETGRKALYVNEGFTAAVDGLTAAESDEFLAALFEHSTKAEFTYRHRWLPGDLVFWDNRSTIHKATGCPPQFRRKMYRTTVEGTAPY